MTIQSGEYAPLSRPLFMYPSAASITDNAAVGPFIQFVVDNYDTIAEAALIVPMDDTQAGEASSAAGDGAGLVTRSRSR